MLNQHWYEYLFLAFTFFCSCNAAMYASLEKPAKVMWFLFVTVVWAALSYFNWTT